MGTAFREAPMYKLSGRANYLQRYEGDILDCGVYDHSPDMKYYNILCDEGGEFSNNNIDCTDESYKALCLAESCDSLADLPMKPLDSFDILDMFGRFVTACSNATADITDFKKQVTFVPNLQNHDSVYYAIQQSSSNIIYSCDEQHMNGEYLDYLCHNSSIKFAEATKLDCADNIGACLAMDCESLPDCTGGVDIYDSSGRFIYQCRSIENTDTNSSQRGTSTCQPIKGQTSYLPVNVQSNYLIQQNDDFINGLTPNFICNHNDSNGQYSNILCTSNAGFEFNRRIDCSSEDYIDMCKAKFETCDDIPNTNLCLDNNLIVYTEEGDIYLSCSKNCKTVKSSSSNETRTLWINHIFLLFFMSYYI